MTNDTHCTRTSKRVSIIVPVYNEAANLEIFHTALIEALAPLPHDIEFLFINDGSHDASQEQIEVLAEKDSRIRYIEVSRNFGKELATTAGFHGCTGDAALCIDADLQHPPELIPYFFKKWEETHVL